jgi:hypothetical protein
MAKGKLNIHRDSFLEKEELVRLMNFIRDNPALFLFVYNAQTFGIIQQGASLTIDPAFKIEVGTNSNTIKMVTDSYALDRNGNMIYQRLFDNLPIPTDSNWYWVKVSHRYDNYEQGFVNIAVDGTLSGVGTAFSEVLRGISSGFPVKIKFFTQADDGTLSTPNNSGIYEVNSVSNDTTAILSGNFTAENHLRYVVLGAFSIKTSVSAITSTGIYSYDSCKIEFIPESVLDTAPTAGFVANEHFYVARIMSNGAVVTVQDKRANYYFRLNFGDIIVSNKANINASNITAPDAIVWRSILDIYTKSEVNGFINGLLVKGQNLNDLPDKVQARSNLGVYSKEYIDQITDNTGKAAVDAANLTAGNIISWLNKLVIYTKTEVNNLIAGFLVGSNNFSDVPNKPQARTNLDVYSKAEVDGVGNAKLAKSSNLSDLGDTPTARANLSVFSKAEQGDLLRKVIEIGDWNMNVSSGGSDVKTVAHGIVDFTKIRNVSAMIRHDEGSAIYPINAIMIVLGSAVQFGGVGNIAGTDVSLYIIPSGGFDNANFNSTGFNRGWVVIDYIA